jgi:hypothetical protein
MRLLGDGQQHKKHMNNNGKKARKESGMNRHKIKRAMRAKRHEALATAPYNPKIGTNARMAVKREAEKRVVA